MYIYVRYKAFISFGLEDQLSREEPLSDRHMFTECINLPQGDIHSVLTRES